MSCVQAIHQHFNVSIMKLLSFVVIAVSVANTVGKDACGVNGVCNCYTVDSTYELYCHDKNLKEIPHNIPFNTFYLDFSHNKIEQIDGCLFENLSSLRTLYLSHNSFKEVPREALKHLKMLTFLDLSTNMIQRLSEDAFSQLSNLMFLFLSENKIARLPKESLSKLPELRELDLSDNLIRHLDEDSFPNLLKIETVELSRNMIWKLNDDIFRKLSSLDELKLSKNFVGEIRRQHLKTITEIRSFVMSHNNLSFLPADLFTDVIVQVSLDFSYNKLTSLPANLFNTSNRTHKLSILLLQRNRLMYIPTDAFVGLPFLKSLCLFYNNIQVLAHNSFKGMGGGRIYLFGNNLSTLESACFNNTKIRQIHVYGNNITGISDVALAGLMVNTALYLDCEQVRELQHPPVNIICVTPKFVPMLPVHGHLKSVLKDEGFKCDTYHCFPCPRGTFGVDGDCFRCPRGGFYQDEIGSVVLEESNFGCKKCPGGTYVINDGGKSIGDCAVCPDGTNKKRHAGYRACFCLETYSRYDRFGQCFICLEKGISCNGKDYMSIQPGFYWNWDFPCANLTNYKKFVENLDTKNSTYDSNTNYDGQFPRAFKCLRRESCKNIGDKVEASCSEGYKGWLCSKCQKKFYSVLNYCLPCPDSERSYIELALICCICVILYAVVYRLYQRRNKRNKGGRFFVDIIMSRGKIVLGYYQVVGEFFTSVHDIYWSKALKFIGDFVSLIELNVFRLIIRPKCFNEKFQINPKLEFLIATLFPCFLICLSMVSYQVMVMRQKCKRRPADVSESLHLYAKKLKSKILAFLLVLLFITYPSMCTSVFQLYPRACETFCLDLQNTTCKTLLRSDYDIQCKDLRTYHILAYISTVVYVVGFPVVLFLLLRKEFKRFLSHVPREPLSAINDETNNDLQNLMDDPSSERTNPLWMDFLCENYKPQFWYWEIVELTRKVTQTVLITLLGWEDKLTVLLTIGISVLYLTLHARYMPMKSRFEQRLQMLSLTAILANVLVATMDVPGEYGDKITVALIILNVLVIVIVAAEVFFGLFIRLKHGEVHKMVFKLVISCKTGILSTFRKRSGLNER